MHTVGYAASQLGTVVLVAVGVMVGVSVGGTGVFRKTRLWVSQVSQVGEGKHQQFSTNFRSIIYLTNLGNETFATEMKLTVYACGESDN